MLYELRINSNECLTEGRKESKASILSSQHSIMSFFGGRGDQIYLKHDPTVFMDLANCCQFLCEMLAIMDGRIY